MQAAMAGGATAFDRLDATAAVSAGRAVLEQGAIALPGGATAAASGAVDLSRGTLDLDLRMRMPLDAPDVGLRLTGPATSPRRLPDLAPWLRWRAER